MKRTVSAILLAAGSSERMRGVNKMLIAIDGLTPADRCVLAFAPFADEIVIAVSDSTRPAAERAAKLSPVPVKIVEGGARRQDSVLNALRAAEFGTVAVHDCARCAVTADVIERALEAAFRTGSGCAAIAVRDTLRRSDSFGTVERGGLAAMQTPQCFDREMLLKAYAALDSEVTDDAAIWRALYGSVTLTEGSLLNQKLTEAGDIEFFRSLAGGGRGMRVGIGEDTHRLAEGRKLVLGGVEIPFRLGLDGHSDADALAHAVIDAMLGAAALGDIGRHFPDNDPAYEGIRSIILLEKTAELLLKNGYRPANIDATVTAQEPKLASFIDPMRKNIADAIGVGIDTVSVKATTPERLGPEGNLQSITVRAVACLERI